MTDHNYYVDPLLDRMAEHRRDAAWYADLLTAARTQLVVTWRNQALLAGPPDRPRIARVPAEAPWWRDLADATALLGRVDGPDGGTALVAVDLTSALDDPAAHPDLSGFGRFADLRAVGPLMRRDEGALLAYARALGWFHQRHRFCGVCGSPTEAREAGHMRRCANPDCGAEMFPRTDPAVIVLVHDGDRCLLGRGAHFPPGMRSVLAGFVEAGESLEQTVAREIREEAGILVDDIRYASSQPWPFPQSLMLGFTARAVTTELAPDPLELEEAGWYGRDELLALPEDGPFRLPRADSIARRLIEDWLGRPWRGPSADEDEDRPAA